MHIYFIVSSEKQFLEKRRWLQNAKQTSFRNIASWTVPHLRGLTPDCDGGDKGWDCATEEEIQPKSNGIRIR